MRLRAHHLLCLLGFRGLGYSPEFVANLSAIHHRLRRCPEEHVAVVDGADAICSACPHLVEDGGACARGDGPETRDRAVLERLRSQSGECGSWSAWQRRLAASFDAEALAQVCAGCGWRSLGYCREGLDALRREHSAVKTPS